MVTSLLALVELWELFFNWLKHILEPYCHLAAETFSWYVLITHKSSMCAFFDEKCMPFMNNKHTIGPQDNHLSQNVIK